MKDFCGIELKTGQTICYPVRQGSKLWQNKALILEVHADHLMVDRIDPVSDRPLKIRNMQTVVVVEGK